MGRKGKKWPRTVFAWQGKCFWRKKRITVVGSKEKIRLKYVLLAFFASERAVIGGKAGIGGISLVNRQEYYQAEWVFRSEQSAEEPGNVYGIRFRPETWELEFYHRQEYLR